MSYTFPFGSIRNRLSDSIVLFGIVIGMHKKQRQHGSVMVPLIVYGRNAYAWNEL